MTTHPQNPDVSAESSALEAINHRRHLSDARLAGEDIDGIPLSYFGRDLCGHLARIDGDDPATMS